MKEIQAKPSGIVLVDDEDYLKFSKVSIRLSEWGYAHYQTMDRFRKNKANYIHKEIMNCPKGFEVDHINGNKLDNRKENLRICTRQENTRNRSIQNNNKSGFIGVYKHPINDSWIAQITKNKKRLYLGSFNTAHKAAVARDLWAKDLYGEFVKLNFVSVGG